MVLPAAVHLRWLHSHLLEFLKALDFRLHAGQELDVIVTGIVEVDFLDESN
jgi:hypothetical protein